MKSKPIVLIAVAVLIVAGATISINNGISMANAEKNNEKPYREKEKGYPEKEKGYPEKNDYKNAYTDSFNLEECTFPSTGSNRYFTLESGDGLVLEGKEGRTDIQLTITVLDETNNISGIETRIVEEKETKDGELVEISRNYFAICNENNSVFYFGEDVAIYEDGEIVSHDGAWQHGVDNARAGLMMPGIALLGSKYYQEVAPEVALDRAVIVSLDATVETPVGEFEGSLKVKETTPLEPTAKDLKWYAPGIGLVQSNTLKLVQHG